MVVKTFELKYPVTVGERTITELKLNRPKTKDFIAVGSLPADSAAADAALLSSLSGEPEVIISQIDIDDLSIIRNELGFIWASYFTGNEYKPHNDAEPNP